jgi:ADP-heptose:LPS heptosyltransferase
MGSLGDVVRGLCLVEQIKRLYPQSRITWLVEPKWADLVRQHQLLDEVLVFDRANWKKGLPSLYRQLKKKHFDCVLDLQRHLKSGFFSLLSRARYRIGFHPKNCKEVNWLFNNHYIEYQNEYYPKIFHYLKFIESLGLPGTQHLDFGLSNLDVQTLNPYLASQLAPSYLVIILGSTWKTKEWFYPNYLTLVQGLLESTDLQIVLLDTKAKQEMASKLASEIDDPRLLNLVGQTSVLELAAILKRAALAVGPDCGAGHLAAAVKTAYIGLFGPTSAKRTAPYGNEHLVLQANVDCAPCYKKKCPQSQRWCMSLIQVKDVQDKIYSKLSK